MDEPTTDSQRRDALHTNPDPELCACAGSGQYQAEGFERFDCPHHDGQIEVTRITIRSAGEALQGIALVNIGGIKLALGGGS